LIPDQLKEDLWVWKKAVAASRLGLPRKEIFGNPPLGQVCFASDATGAALAWIDGISKNITVEGDRGVASVEHKGGKIMAVSTLKWPKGLLVGKKSRSGAYFGSKSATLEMVGLFLPFLTQPQNLAGKHVVLQVDNTAVVYAWQKKYTVQDPETSLLVRSLHVLEAFLECKIYVEHLKRLSNHVASVVDSLSRTSTTSPELLSELAQTPWTTPRGALVTWLQNPVLDWDLPLKIADDVKTLLNPNVQ
jgi:hypothetical protein